MATRNPHLRTRTGVVRAIATVSVAAAALVGATLAAPAPSAASNVQPGYGWPVKPFDRQHPVRGFFGDPRIGMTPEGMHRGFHFGVDISCPNGTPVYATLDGVVRRESFRPETVTIVGRDGRTHFGYWHIKPAVENGEHVVAYRTLVGWVQPPWEHVHFAERRGGVYVNPLRPGALRPYVDTTCPWVKQLRAEGQGALVPTRTIHRIVALVVEAYDRTPILVPGRWGGKPVTPALLRWRLTTRDGRVAMGWRTAIDHTRITPDDAAYSSQYARWTRQNKRNRPGRYRFVLAARWDSRTVADGRYVVEVAASDASGNSALGRFPIAVANGAARV